MNSTVFEFQIKGLLKVVVTGTNDDRYKRYLQRIGAEADSPEAKVAYSCSEAGSWKINGEVQTKEGEVCKSIQAKRRRGFIISFH